MSESVEVVKLCVRRLDGSCSSTVRSLFQTAWAGAAKMVVLDLSDVLYMDSLGVSVLVAEHRRKPFYGRIIVCGLSDYVREVFEVTQLFRLFDVHSDAASVSAYHGAQG